MSGVLEARDLVKRFPAGRSLFGPPRLMTAVDGVSLSVEEGETLAIVGESGCGKSTLARLLIRLLEPDEGRVLLNGRDVTHLPESRLRPLRRALQFIFQDPFSSLNPRMSVGALVEEPMRAHGLGTAAERRARALALLARVGLRPEHAGRYPHEFSGGQRQRVGIARALATGPSVLIGDEPVSALDVSVQAQVINLLQDLKADFGLTLIVIAHDLGVIRHMSDRVAVMYLGQIVELAPARSFFAGPLHPYARALVAATPGAGGGAPLKGEPPSPADPPPGCRFHRRCPHAEPRCAEGRPPLLAVGEGRSVACFRWREIGAGPAAPAAPALTEAAAARFALYRDALDAKGPASAPQ
ncbi:ABC transporter ATP-binding protein [Rubrimonas cliftonensis]|uniref:Glutathione import ATP-binding protein GsiA n=1 Tax=Rubrimonas cliftonensis TaxID=89524 RepID=A0A1H4AJ96_9RHOB|nr:oligopeptide/dipeptide ABC transporter ATP-binding protein [Rubrimonas cliftonensis]SEA35848.1 peptide/nickel transport system ATP-binding protein [Rubrimonas cliftonensis]